MARPNLQLSRRVYGLLLKLYPKSLRDRFAAAQAETFEDWLTEARAERGFTGVAGVWREAACDWAWSMMLAYREAVSLAGAAQAATSALLAASLAMWMMIAASMLAHLSWATDFVETHTAPNTWVALGAPCAAVMLSALVNPWRSRRRTAMLAASVLVCASAWSVALTTWRG